jgi:hypothetical protein
MSKLKEFMPAQVRAALGEKPTWHSNCIAATSRKKTREDDETVSVGGIARPGKTARDRARRGSRG